MRGISVGIDLGTTTTTTVVVRRGRDGKIRIVGVGSAPSAGLRRGSVVDIKAAAQALKHSIAEASRASGTTIRSAFLGIGGSHVGSFVTRGAITISRADGEITDADVLRVMQAAEGFIPKNPNREVIHVIPREFKVDGQAVFHDPVGMVGMKLEVEALVIDGAKPALQNLIKCCELTGIEIEDWGGSVLAAAEVLLTKKQKELGVILLDLGAGTSDFAVFEEGQVVDVGSFPIGGSHITADIAIGFRTQVGAAEEIKVRYAQALVERAMKRETIRLADFVSGDDAVFATRDLVEIIAARLTDVFELTTKALRKLGRSGLLPGGAVLTGGVADIPGVQDLARRELKLPVEVAKAAVVDAVADVIPPRLAVPVGLVVWQIEREGALTLRGGKRWQGMAERIKRFLRAFVP